MTSAAMKRAAPLLKANRARSREAAANQVDRAEFALERLARARRLADTRFETEVIDRYLLALQLRIDHPRDTLAELAARSPGWSKDRYWAILSRALKYGSHR